MKLVECVPNFSEGRDMAVLDKIKDAINAVEGAHVLDVDPGADTNRTVFTFVGTPEGVEEAAFRAIEKAAELIDMRNQTGTHPRMGATDVCPFIPVAGVTVEECVAISQRVAERAGRELGIPMFLYAKSARRPDREKLPDIRQGEYEALEAKLATADFKPDYGPASFNAKAGATAVGVRDFMMAYNINLNTPDRKMASDIALTIRERGRAKRDKDGEIMRNPDGSAVKVPGRLSHCQAAGWYIDEYGYAQVTMNLHQFRETGLEKAFDVTCEEAEMRGLRVTGSELIGMVPKEAMLQAGRHYLKKMGKSTGIPERDIIHIAALSLGLSDTSPFVIEDRVIEYAIEKGKKAGRLREMTVSAFANELSSDSPAPGGGSVAALSGALASALTSMVAALTHGNPRYRRAWSAMEDLGVEAQDLKDRFLTLIDKDTDAYTAFMDAMRRPKKTDAERSARHDAMQAAARLATEVPLETLRLAARVTPLAETAVKRGNQNAMSDGAVAAIHAEAAAEAAFLNVSINLPGVDDEAFVAAARSEASELLARVKRDRKRVVTFATRRIKGD
jgi:glutamate formiminotransferase/formiminotetrahydrofolate cyclodeaminase